MPRIGAGRLFGVYCYVASTVWAAWFLRHAAAERGGSLGTVRSLAWQGSIYAPWIPVAFLTAWLLRRFGTGGRALVALAVACAAITPLESLLASAIDMLFQDARWSAPALAARALGRAPIALLLFTAMAAATLAFAHRRSALEARALTLDLEAALAAARAALVAPADSSARLSVMAGGGRVLVDLAEVEWFASAGNYVVVHWGRREGLLRETLQALERRLDPRVFARSHRSSLVNLGRVRGAQSLSDGSWRLTMESGADLVASRTYRDDLLARLGV